MVNIAVRLLAVNKLWKVKVTTGSSWWLEEGKISCPPPTEARRMMQGPVSLTSLGNYNGAKLSWHNIRAYKGQDDDKVKLCATRLIAFSEEMGGYVPRQKQWMFFASSLTRPLTVFQNNQTAKLAKSGLDGWVRLWYWVAISVCFSSLKSFLQLNISNKIFYRTLSLTTINLLSWP